MALTTYTELKAAIADLASRTDLTSQIVDCVTLAEAEMQADCKLLEFEALSTVTITSGSGTLPTGFLGARSVYWDGSPDYPLTYVTPDRFDSLRGNDSGDGHYYTITGSTIKTTPQGSGSVVMTAMVRFAPLSVSVASNAILANFPNAYLYGSLKHLAIYMEDDAKLQKFGTLFNAEKERIRKNDEDRRFAGPLTVRAR